MRAAQASRARQQRSELKPEITLLLPFSLALFCSLRRGARHACARVAAGGQ
jgi:hypothetical protein